MWWYLVREERVVGGTRVLYGRDPHFVLEGNALVRRYAELIWITRYDANVRAAGA